MRVAVRAVVVLLVPVMFGLGTVAAFAGSATASGSSGLIVAVGAENEYAKSAGAT